jgi:hypothetical protein
LMSNHYKEGHRRSAPVVVAEAVASDHGEVLAEALRQSVAVVADGEELVQQLAVPIAPSIAFMRGCRIPLSTTSGTLPPGLPIDCRGYRFRSRPLSASAATIPARTATTAADTAVGGSRTIAGDIAASAASPISHGRATWADTS